MQNILLARRTLERLRVMALHNELSGVPEYETETPTGSCHCAVGAIMPPDILADIVNEGCNGEDIGGALPGDALEEMERVTGLSCDMLDALQKAHDNPADFLGILGREVKLDRKHYANLAVLQWAETQLATLF